MLDERNEEEIKYATLGRGSLNDMLSLKKCYAIFRDESNTHYIMLPGYVEEECSNYDISVLNHIPEKIDDTFEEQIDLLKKVFDIQEVSMHYGVIVELI